MKRWLCILIGGVLVLSMPGMTIAQEKGKPEQSAEASQAPKPKSSISPKGPSESEEYRMGGVITAIDAASKSITIEQRQVKRERSVRLSMGNTAAKLLPDLKVGDSVNIWARGKRVTTLQKVS